MKADVHERLEDSQKLSVPVATISGLWRRSALRAPGGRDRRTHVRIPTDDAAEVIVLGSVSPEPMDARVVDISRGGMRLRILSLLTPGTTLRVRLGDTEVTAEVRYCVASEGAYCAGVKVQHVV